MMMKAALFSLAILGTRSAIAVADNVPKISNQSLCRARAADDRIMNLPPSLSECLRQENDAKQKLDLVWGTTPARLRNRCRADAVTLGTLSYLDLLTCVQMTDDAKPLSPAKNSPAKNAPAAANRSRSH
ncbi:hypothetical protein [Bradyrhizobium sp.]|uniref:hypothetical protein n=1 Tax=Bradyrhizobium sp. TaxID=376 RepID=UPI003C6B634C